MSHILAQWLNENSVSQHKIHPQNIHSQFANGFLIAKLLHNNNLLNNHNNNSKNYSHKDTTSSYANATFPHAFSRENTTDAAIKNYSLLRDVLHGSLGIKLSSNQACNLINEKEGAAAMLLYQIKIAIANRGNKGWRDG